ncbi:hypothetical protein DRO61_08870 [Candidatus Bathyarchaeota archaeon]|nr:MAG: hypothetical protein DRO61_08870 [Candidatus Bathyarchaeota archaeon]
MRERLKEENIYLAETLTKDREFFVTSLLDKLQTRKERKGVYGEGGMVESLDAPTSVAAELVELKEIQQAQISMQAEQIVTSDIIGATMELLSENQETWHDETKKQERKMLGVSKDLVQIEEDNLKIQKKMNFRQIRQSLWKTFSGVFSAISGVLPLLITWITGGGIKKWVGNLFSGVISTAFKQMFKTGIFSQIGPMLTRLGPLLLKFGGPLAALATAGFVGWKMGQGIDKLLGISEKFSERLDVADVKAREQGKELSASQGEMFKRAKEGSARGKQEVKQQTLIGSASGKRQQDMGVFGRGNIYAINTAQQNYMNENMDTYLNYSFEEQQRIREEWFRSGSRMGSLGLFGTPEKYGKIREAKFLTYLMKHGTKLTDRGAGVVTDPSALAKGEATAEVAKDKPLLDAMKQQTKAALDRTKDLGAGIRDGLIQTSNAVSTSVSNISTINNNNNNAVQPQLSPYALGVMRGEMTEV